MGRKKIRIAPLTSKRATAITLKKRQPGLMKKAYELAVLCNVDVFVFVRHKDTRVTDIFSSTNEDFIPDYTNDGLGERKGPRDFESRKKNFGSQRKQERHHELLTAPLKFGGHETGSARSSCTDHGSPSLESEQLQYSHIRHRLLNAAEEARQTCSAIALESRLYLISF